MKHPVSLPRNLERSTLNGIPNKTGPHSVFQSLLISISVTINNDIALPHLILTTTL